MTTPHTPFGLISEHRSEQGTPPLIELLMGAKHPGTDLPTIENGGIEPLLNSRMLFCEFTQPDQKPGYCRLCGTSPPIFDLKGNPKPALLENGYKNSLGTDLHDTASLKSRPQFSTGPSGTPNQLGMIGHRR